MSEVLAYFDQSVGNLTAVSMTQWPILPVNGGSVLLFGAQIGYVGKPRANRTKQRITQRKLDCVRLDPVGGTHRTGPHPVGFGIADKLSLAQIELQVPLQSLADVCSQADVHGPIHDFRIRHRELA